LRRIPMSRRSHVTGFQALGAGLTEHESALERDFVTLSSFLDPTARILAQPVTIRFEDGVRSRRYTPDYLVFHSNLSQRFVEVKYRCDLLANRERLEPAFAAMRAWAAARSASFSVVTEDLIRGPTLDNAKRLLPLRHAPMDSALAEVALRSIRERMPPTLGETVSALPMRRPVALTILWQLIARGLICVDFALPITPDTPVLLR
jgi:hypothetical protein